MLSYLKKTEFIKYALLLFSIAVMGGCINDSYDDCPDEEDITPLRQLLYFTIADVLTGEDVSQSEYLEGIEVYLFDRNKDLVKYQDITMDMIRGNVPLDITSLNLEGGYVSVWSNVNSSMDFSPIVLGNDMEVMSLSMSVNRDIDGYHYCPGDIFFGSTKLEFDPVSQTAEADTVIIKRKNASLNITVKGLETLDSRASSDDYFYDIHAIYTGYNFAGTPQHIGNSIRESGEFNENGLFVTPDPLLMIHHVYTDIYNDDNCLGINLYRKGDTRQAESIIAYANRDINGDYILLRSGEVTNVLIELTAGSMNVYVVVTPWGEIIQWENW